MPVRTRRTVVRTSFVATNGTLLENYVNGADIGSVFRKTSAPPNEALTYQNQLTGIGGQSNYLASGVPARADYAVSFRVIPRGAAGLPPNGNYVGVIARANADGSTGYFTGMFSNGAQYIAFLIVQNKAITIEVQAGTATSYTVTMTLTGASIVVQVQRADDSKWLTSAGTWTAATATAISLIDRSYKQPGRILVSGVW